MSYVYIESEPNLYTVGFYKPDGKFEPESDHATGEAAAERVHWLNGGQRSNRLSDEYWENIEKKVMERIQGKG